MYLLPYLAFNIVGHNYRLHHHVSYNGVHVHVNLNDQFAMIESMKAACWKAATTLCVELFYKFPGTEIMSTIGVVYS
jgi:hypothetical protein